MTEYQILNMFWMQAISNAMFQLGVFVLLWAALRGSLRIYDQGANLFTKIISSLFGLGIVYSGKLEISIKCLKHTFYLEDFCLLFE